MCAARSLLSEYKLIYDCECALVRNYFRNSFDFFLYIRTKHQNAHAIKITAATTTIATAITNTTTANKTDKIVLSAKSRSQKCATATAATTKPKKEETRACGVMVARTGMILVERFFLCFVFFFQ